MMKYLCVVLLVLCTTAICACSKGEEKKQDNIAYPQHEPIELDGNQKKGPKLSPEARKILEQDKAIQKKAHSKPHVSDKELLGNIPQPKF
ncbi:hypothetical protein JMF94_14810 [Desulfovibrio sp. UIB00]|uniref:hypothetical protein n=1 Tax=Desulfovibrio sp. UIB00 TaxID=2804314 RepID=UPI001F0EFB8C|nr:hypothetical protein [Desulfovibrio sp. UIB00]MCH5146352.1 hypothetical protein [Desulfovibrio sp. UIB00]